MVSLVPLRQAQQHHHHPLARACNGTPALPPSLPPSFSPFPSRPLSPPRYHHFPLASFTFSLSLSLPSCPWRFARSPRPLDPSLPPSLLPSLFPSPGIRTPHPPGGDRGRIRPVGRGWPTDQCGEGAAVVGGVEGGREGDGGMERLDAVMAWVLERRERDATQTRKKDTTIEWIRQRTLDFCSFDCFSPIVCMYIYVHAPCPPSLPHPRPSFLPSLLFPPLLPSPLRCQSRE